MVASTKASSGWVSGTGSTASALAKRPSPSVAMTIGRRLVRPVDRHLLGHVVDVRAGEAGGADQDQRLGREVDVLLVLGGVAGDRLVAELGELDPQLLGGDPVGAVADDGPVPPGRAPLVGGGGDAGPGRPACWTMASGRSRMAREQALVGRPRPTGRRWRRRAGSRRRSGRRTPWSTARPSRRRDRRTCRARRRPGR